ncbi:MAG TPA: RsmB/NOP family class I SAM-dependent RNA methyltransferase [Candidatus Kapabacteria bacterium]|nr:RsmB/NOP family class I SAM-dependent RNA methyltransferase [Candidatus Kapabacteria bacterium]
MRLLGLIDNTALLLSIAKRNPAPTDKVAAEFLKTKRSLGSNDRRFVLDVLFVTLRNLTLLEHLTERLIRNSNLPNYFSKNESIQSKVEDIITIINTLFLITSNSDFHQYSNIFEYLNQKEKSFYTDINKLVSEVVQHTFYLSNDILTYWKKNLSFHYELIKNSFLNTNNTDTLLDVNYLKNIELYYSFPEWIMNELLIKNDKNFEFFSKLAFSFTQNAPITIRINQHKNISVHYIEEELSKNNVTLEKCKLSPVAYNLSKRLFLNDNPLYKNGIIEIQDEASQLVSYALAPDEDWVVLDACAGAGGKSLHLADLQNNKGKIIALDKEYNRLKEIPKRARNANISTIFPYLIDKSNNPRIADENIKFFRNRSFDAVLIDAPCSGMGTLRRDPMKKYRTTPRLIEKLSEIQYRILKHYSQFLRKGGVLVYATCSIMPRENEIVVERFLAEHSEFAPSPIAEGFSKHRIPLPDLKDRFYYTFYPHIHNTDGFFIARMTRKM